jgi:SpoVK/Ycf46/Vps4 family AAA+-type ATPase
VTRSSSSSTRAYRDERKEIFAIHLARRDRDPARFDLGALADAAGGFSGAEIEQALVSALSPHSARRAT